MYGVDKISPKIAAFEIHELLNDQWHIEEEEAKAIRIDSLKRQVFKKNSRRNAKLVDLFSRTNGMANHAHVNDENSPVIIALVRLRTRTLRTANLPGTSECSSSD